MPLLVHRIVLLASLLLACAWVAPSRADVVPPRAVEVAEGWLALVDAGRDDEALRRFGDERDADAMRRLRLDLASVRGARTPAIRTRTIRSWSGHGTGDVSAMSAGSYWALILETLDAAGRTRADEIRLVPRGDDWRVVGYVASG